MIDVTLCERFGWTLEQLDEQDESRLMEGVKLTGIHSAMQRAQRAINAHGHPDPQDLEIFGWAMGYNANE